MNSIIGHLNSSSSSSSLTGGGDVEEGIQKPTEKTRESAKVPSLSLSDFLDFRRNKPWVLVPGGSFMGYFDFVPVHLRQGPWSITGAITVFVVLSLAALEGIRVFWTGRFLGCFEEQQREEGNHEHAVAAFTGEWCFAVLGSLWTLFVCWCILKHSAIGVGAWATFTVWSWTVLALRFFLCAAAPFLPTATTRLPLGVLRFPALFSATLTFFLWNFVLFPVILAFFRNDPAKRRRFLGYMTNFRLTQLHVFNIFLASGNALLLGPRPWRLHYGDAVAAGTMLLIYMVWYYFVLDRIGVHLYPIFSPRTPFVVFSYALFFAACYCGFYGWQRVLEAVYNNQ